MKVCPLACLEVCLQICLEAGIMYIWEHVCRHVWKYACMYGWKYACVCVCVCVCIHMYLHIPHVYTCGPTPHIYLHIYYVYTHTHTYICMFVRMSRFLKFILLGIYFIYISNAIPKVPHTLPHPLTHPPTPTSWPCHSPILRHIKFARPMGLSFHWWPTRPSSDTYAARDTSMLTAGKWKCQKAYSNVPSLPWWEHDIKPRVKITAKL